MITPAEAVLDAMYKINYDCDDDNNRLAAAAFTAAALELVGPTKFIASSEKAKAVSFLLQLAIDLMTARRTQEET
jgi:hypothetical protein